MLLRRQFSVLAMVAGVVLVLSLLAAWSTLVLVAQATAQIAQAQATVRGVTNFRYLTMETLLYGEARSKRQWQARIVTFRQTLDQHVYTAPEELALLAREQANLIALNQLFQRLDGSGAGIADNRTRAIVGAMFSTTEAMLDDGFELIARSQERLKDTQRRAAWVVFMAMLGLVSLIGCMTVIIKRRVLRPVAALQAVTEHIADGNMAARVNFFSPDELGMLGRTFDSMTGQLEQSHQAMRHENAERRSAQEGLARAQADLQTILDHMPALVVYWDTDLRNRFASRDSEEWFGMTPAQMRGKHLSEVVGAQQYRAMAAKLQSVQTGNSELFEDSLILPTGERRHALFSYTPDIQSGHIAGIYGVISDVTELKRAEAGQARALRKLESVLTAASDFSIIQTNVDGIIELFSPGAERMLGYSAAELLQRQTPAIFHRDDEVAARAAALSTQFGRPVWGFEAFVAEAREGRSVSSDWTYIKKDGTQLPVNLTVTAIQGEGGDIDGFLGIAKDVSAERDIRRVLAAARDHAEQASLAKSQFLANMSHEIRTPMNAVLGMLELLGYTELSVLQREYADKARGAANSLLSLLNDILDFSQVEANRIVLESAPFSVESLLRDLSVIVSSLVGDKETEVLFSIDPKISPWLQGDVTRLRQILINLAGNALKFTAHGEVMIKLTLHSHAPQGSDIEFEVHDTGIGIASDKLERIFDAFTQAEASTARRFGGTGLGLTISQRLVALMGGTLRADSIMGVGSCFRFRLTFAAAEAGESLPVPPILPSSLRILIVDDSAAARAVLGQIVRSCGWVALEVGGPTEALSALETAYRARQPVDVVVLDWHMRETDDWALARRSQMHSGFPPLVAMVTASDRAALATLLPAEQAMLKSYVTKPVTPAMLRDAITAALPGQSTQAVTAVAHVRTQRLAGLRVLVVDDNALNQQVARELLLHEGAAVEVASGGAAALTMANDAAPGFDAILLDIQMPGMDGYDCARAMRHSSALKDTPIIAMTANVMDAERAACLAAGMNAHLGKPIYLDTMVQLLRSHCGWASEPLPMPGRAHLELTSAVVPHAESDELIEFDQALARMGGKHDLFLSLAATFSTEANTFLAVLKEHLAARDETRAADAVHAFKSIAAILGAGRLHAFCNSLELGLRSGAPPSQLASALGTMATLVHASAAQLEAVCSAVDAVSGQATSITQPSAISMPLPELLDELAMLLQASNMRALSVIARIEQEHGAALGARLTDLSGSIARLDFVAAISHCAQLRSEIS